MRDATELVGNGTDDIYRRSRQQLGRTMFVERSGRR